MRRRRARRGPRTSCSAVVAESCRDLAVVDIRMPPGGNAGLTAALDIRARYGDRVRVLVLSQYLEPEYALRLLGRGRRRHRLPAQGPAGRGQRAGRRGPARRRRRFRDRPGRRRRARPGAALERPARPTDRRASRRSWRCVAEGRSNRSIADALGLTAKTVEGAIGIIFSKLGLEEDARDNRRVLAVLAYLDGRPAAASAAQPRPTRASS